MLLPDPLDRLTQLGVSNGSTGSSGRIYLTGLLLVVCRRVARGEATARGGEERAVALIGAQRSEALGFQDRVRAVRLSSESVERHPRYAAFETADWQRVQRILDRGEWIEQPARHRLLWLDEDGKPWAAVVKLTENGEVYLQSYRRASRRNVGKWEER